MFYWNSRERSVEEKQADTLIAKTSSQKGQAPQPSVAQSPLLSSSSSSSVKGGDDRNARSNPDNGKKKSKLNKSVKTDTLISEQHTEIQTQNSSTLNEYNTNTSLNSSTLLNADTSAVVELPVTPCRTESPVPNTDISISDTVIEWRKEEEVLLWSKSPSLLESNSNSNSNTNSQSVAQRRLKGPQRADFSIGTYSTVRAP